LGNNTEYLWGPIRGNFRKVYYVSIALVLVGFLPFAYFLLTCSQWTSFEVNRIFITFITLIVASWLWILLAVWFAKKSYNRNLLRFLIVLILLIVSLSIAYFIYLLSKHKPLHLQGNMKTLIYIGLYYAFFHTFFMDFILWAYLVLFR
jgi:FlaA1/EpsC-like NDP-sugar epimerase